MNKLTEKITVGRLFRLPMGWRVRLSLQTGNLFVGIYKDRMRASTFVCPIPCLTLEIYRGEKIGWRRREEIVIARNFRDRPFVVVSKRFGGHELGEAIKKGMLGNWPGPPFPSHQQGRIDD